MSDAIRPPATPEARQEATVDQPEEVDERLRILRLVARGTISPPEAAALLEALQPPTSPARPVPPVPPVPPRAPFYASAPAPAAAIAVPGSPWPEPRTLVIRATDNEGEVNVRLPLGLAMSSSRFLSRRVRQRLEQHEIELDELLQSAGAFAGSDAPGQVVYVTDGEGELKITLE